MHAELNCRLLAQSGGSGPPYQRASLGMKQNLKLQIFHSQMHDPLLKIYSDVKEEGHHPFLQLFKDVILCACFNEMGKKLN